MKEIRPIYIDKCAICGEEHDIFYMRKVFTGRTRYICPACDARGNRQVSEKQKDWRRSSRGKAVVEHFRKNK